MTTNKNVSIINYEYGEYKLPTSYKPVDKIYFDFIDANILLSETNAVFSDTSSLYVDLTYKEPIKFIFDDEDIIQNNNASNIVFVFGKEKKEVPNKCVYTYSESNTFYCGCSPSYDATNNNFNISCDSSQILISSVFYDGSSFKTSIANFFNTTIYSGETLNSNLIFVDKKLLSVSFTHGHNLKPQINTLYNISSSISHGENVKSNLKYTVSSKFDNCNMVSGENISLSLKTITSYKINVDIQSGDNFNIKLNPTYSFGFNFYHGDNITSNLSSKNVISPNMSSGELLNLSLKTYSPKYFNINSYDGSDVNTDINSSIIFDDVIFEQDSTLDGDIEYRPLSDICSDFYHGEYIILEQIINNSIFTNINFYNGSQLNYTLKENKPLYIDTKLYNGENFKQKINITTGFRPNIYVGDNIRINSIDSLPNIYFTNGENLESSLFTNVAMKSKFEFGESFKVNLTPTPNIPFDTMQMYDGSQFDINLDIQYSTTFSPNFIQGMQFECGYGNSLYKLDLNRYTCCEKNGNELKYVNLSRDDEIGVSYEQNNHVKFNMNMSMVRLFKLNFLSGEQSYIKDYNKYFSINCYDGHNVTAKDLYNDLNINLVMGNPDYTNIIPVIEIEKGNTDYVNSFSSSYSGDTLFCGLNYSLQFGIQWYSGEVFKGNMRYYAPLRINFYDGSRLYCKLNGEARLSTKPLYAGEMVSTRFYEPPILGAMGENVDIQLTFNYDVTFDEEGCLLNTYIPIDENGVPIYDDINEMAIEGGLYSHYVRGKCY